MLGELFIARSRYWLTKEYPTKLRRCIDSVPPAAVWARPNQSCNSIGNLLLHLTGNVSEWILGGVGGQSVIRHRSGEFLQRQGADGQTLIKGLEAVLAQADSVLAGLNAQDLERSIVIQGRDTTMLGAIYHV